MKRCAWCEGNELYQKYHDLEWGVPVYDDREFFEFLVLESAQAGLSWITILKKRENYRKAYDNFRPDLVAKYDETKIMNLLNNEGIVRNRLKITSSIANAKLYLQIQKEFKSFSNYIWQFVNHKPIINKFKKMEDIPATTELSDKISLDLKKRGFKFVGSTIIYAFLQATGLVNDHVTECYRYQEIITIYKD